MISLFRRGKSFFPNFLLSISLSIFTPLSLSLSLSLILPTQHALKLFDSFWFHSAIFSNKPASSPPPPAPSSSSSATISSHEGHDGDDEDDRLLLETKLSRAPILHVRCRSDHKLENMTRRKERSKSSKSLHRDIDVAAKLVAALSLCSHMALPISVFDQIPEPTTYLYNILIRASTQNSRALRAFASFFQMQRNGVFPDNYTYPYLFRACCGQASLSLVQMIRAHIEKFGFCADIFVPNSLIDTYYKCGSLGVRAARKLFDSMEVRDTVSWNTMINGLVKAKQLLEARQLFDEMPERDTISWNVLSDGYAKAGEMNDGFELFGEIPRRSIVSKQGKQEIREHEEEEEEEEGEEQEQQELVSARVRGPQGLHGSRFVFSEQDRDDSDLVSILPGL